MSIFTQFVRSLLLTSMVAFITPIIFVGGLLMVLSLLSYIPIVGMIGVIGIDHLCKFLTIFGDGSTIEGMLVICTSFGIVGALFDACNFYRYQVLNGN